MSGLREVLEFDSTIEFLQAEQYEGVVGVVATTNGMERFASWNSDKWDGFLSAFLNNSLNVLAIVCVYDKESFGCLMASVHKSSFANGAVVPTIQGNLFFNLRNYLLKGKREVPSLKAGHPEASDVISTLSATGNMISNALELPLEANVGPSNLGEERDEDLPSACVSNSLKWSEDSSTFNNVGSHYNPDGSCKNLNLQFLGSGLSPTPTLVPT
ncbi:unnamed protein product [Sphagnum compactum]